jgi:hypothetical protein
LHARGASAARLAARLPPTVREFIVNEYLQQLMTVIALLFVWSRAGEALPGTSINAHYVSALLVFGAALRSLAARLHADFLLDLTLALDAYAVAVYCGEHHRQQRLQPRRDALLFAAAMPVERALQSRIGSELLQASLPAAHS